jgi:hypothetical protein
MCFYFQIINFYTFEIGRNIVKKYVLAMVFLIFFHKI